MRISHCMTQNKNVKGTSTIMTTKEMKGQLIASVLTDS